MLTKFAILGSVLCFSLAGAFEVTPSIEDGIGGTQDLNDKYHHFEFLKKCSGIPRDLNITEGPFLKIGLGYYYIELNTQKNWFDSFVSCRRLGANLVSFETIQEWEIIHQYLWNNKIYNYFWVSGTDLANQGRHDWFSTGKPISLNIWHPGEPNNMNGVEHCDVLGYRATEVDYNTLNDDNCENKFLYICEAPLAKAALFVNW